MEIGERIKMLRENYGVSQTKLADILDVSKQAIYKYETGIVTNIPMDKIEKMASVFNCSPSYIMGWDEEDQMSDYMEKLRTNPGMRILFDAAKDATQEDLEKAARIIEALKGGK